MYASRVCACTLKGLALPRASHSSEIALSGSRRGSASPCRTRCCHSSQNRAPLEKAQRLVPGLFCNHGTQSARMR